MVAIKVGVGFNQKGIPAGPKQLCSRSSSTNTPSEKSWKTLHAAITFNISSYIQEPGEKLATPTTPIRDDTEAWPTRRNMAIAKIFNDGTINYDYDFITMQWITEILI